jgi:hypothetical protein
MSFLFASQKRNMSGTCLDWDIYTSLASNAFLSLTIQTTLAVPKPRFRWSYACGERGSRKQILWRIWRRCVLPKNNMPLTNVWRVAYIPLLLSTLFSPQLHKTSQLFQKIWSTPRHDCGEWHSWVSRGSLITLPCVFLKRSFEQPMFEVSYINLSYHPHLSFFITPKHFNCSQNSVEAMLCPEKVEVERTQERRITLFWPRPQK